MRALVLVGLLVAPAHADVVLDQPAGVCALDGVRVELDALPRIARDGDVQIATTIEGERVLGSVTIGDDVRAVSARDCRELAKSIALIIVMSLRDAEPVSSVTSAVEPPRDVPALRVEEPERVVVRVARATRPAFAALVGGTGDLHGQPSLLAGVRARHGRYSLGLEAQAEGTTRVAVEDGGQISVSRKYATLAPCVHVAQAAFCGVMAAGALRGRASELADAASVTRALVQVGGRAEWSYPIAARIGLRVHVDAVQALTRAEFLVDQMPVWTSDSRELRLGGAVVAHFP